MDKENKSDKSELKGKLSRIDIKRKIKMPDGSYMTQEEIDEKYGETTPMINMPKKDRFRKMSTTTGRRG